MKFKVGDRVKVKMRHPNSLPLTPGVVTGFDKDAQHHWIHVSWDDPRKEESSYWLEDEIEFDHNGVGLMLHVVMDEAR